MTSFCSIIIWSITIYYVLFTKNIKIDKAFRQFRFQQGSRGYEWKLMWHCSFSRLVALRVTFGTRWWTKSTIYVYRIYQLFLDRESKSYRSSSTLICNATTMSDLPKFYKFINTMFDSVTAFKGSCPTEYPTRSAWALIEWWVHIILSSVISPVNLLYGTNSI